MTPHGDGHLFAVAALVSSRIDTESRGQVCPTDTGQDARNDRDRNQAGGAFVQAPFLYSCVPSLNYAAAPFLATKVLWSTMETSQPRYR